MSFLTFEESSVLSLYCREKLSTQPFTCKCSKDWNVGSNSWRLTPKTQSSSTMVMPPATWPSLLPIFWPTVTPRCFPSPLQLWLESLHFFPLTEERESIRKHWVSLENIQKHVTTFLRDIPTKKCQEVIADTSLKVYWCWGIILKNFKHLYRK